MAAAPEPLALQQAGSVELTLQLVQDPDHNVPQCLGQRGDTVSCSSGGMACPWRVTPARAWGTCRGHLPRSRHWSWHTRCPAPPHLYGKRSHLLLGRRVSGSHSRAGTQPRLRACPTRRFLNSQKTFRCPEGVTRTKQGSPSELCFTLASFQHQPSPAAGVGEAGARAQSPAPPMPLPCPSPAPVTCRPFGNPRRGDSRTQPCTPAGCRCAQWSLPRFPPSSQQPTRSSRLPGACSAPQSS